MNIEEYNKLTIGEKFIFDWQHGTLSGFKVALINLIKISDEKNRAKLRKAYPEEVDAYNDFSRKENWFQDLCKKLEVNL